MKKKILKDGVKFDNDKERFDLLPSAPLIKLAQIYTFGAKKYDDRNMEKGMKWGRVFAAIMRHLWKWWGGEENDQESGMSHLAHAAWGCFTLLDYTERRREFDDRPIKPNPNEYEDMRSY